MKFVITTSPGLEAATAEEIKQLIQIEPTILPQGSLILDTDLPRLVRVLCGSFLASRVLQPLADFHAWEKEVLYKEVKTIPWHQIIGEGETFVMDVHGKSDGCDYSAAQGLLKAKDALVDQIREKTGWRPDVDKENPTHQIELYFWKGRVEISIDLTGEPMHRRGYRVGVPGPAPLRESRAAALLKLAGLGENTPDCLYDPFCGTGTIAIEAAMMLRKIPPANLRYIPKKKFIEGFQKLYLDTLTELRNQSLPKCPVPILASDVDYQIIPRAQRFAAKARVEADIKFEQSDFEQVNFGKGWLIANVPFGERLQTEAQCRELLATLGRQIKFKSEIERMVLLVPAKLETATGMKPAKKSKWRAGPLEITAARYEIWRGRKDLA